jgi:hypothetical protein
VAIRITAHRLQIASLGEGRAVANSGQECGRVDHADARNARQLSSLLILAGQRGELVVISSDPLIEAFPLFTEILQQP